MLRTIGEIGDDGARYMAIEFTGEAIHDLPMEGRLTITNMTIEAGGKNGILLDETTREWLSTRTNVPYEPVEADEGATYTRVIEFDCSKMEPQIAAPYLPSNVQSLSALAGTKINQVVIGSCTNGRISDLRLAAQILVRTRSTRACAASSSLARKMSISGDARGAGGEVRCGGRGLQHRDVRPLPRRLHGRRG